MNHAKAVVAELLARSGLLWAMRRLRERVLHRPRLTILCYHRVAAGGALLSPQCVPAPLFDAHMAYCARHLQLLTLADVEAYLQGRLQLDRDAVVVTFDDGYRDNLTHAMPILERHGITATFFLTSTPVLDGQPIWIDELASLLEALHGQPVVLDGELPAATLRCLSAYLQAPPAQRAARAKELFRLLNSMSDAEKSRVLRALRQALADAGLTPAPTPPMMSAEDVDMLRRCGHQVGAHTQSHPRLSSLSPTDIAREIRGSAARLRARFGEVPHLAYPFGKPDDLPQDRSSLFAITRSCGFSLAVTTSDAVVRPQDHRYLVPRKVISPQPLAQVRLKLELMAWAR